MARKKKTISGLTVTGIADRGKAVARSAEGQVVFVDSAVPGDEVTALILRKKKSFLQGKTMSVEKQSIHRSQPFCNHFNSCGGCKWQNLDYSIQLDEKESNVKSNIRKIAKEDPEKVLPIIGAAQTRYYRNKMEYSFSSMRWLTEEEIKTEEQIEAGSALGFHAPGSFAKVVEIHTCHLQDDYANTIRNSIRTFAHAQSFSFYNPLKHTGLLRNMIIRNTSIGEWMLVMIFGQDSPSEIKTMMEFLKTSFSNLTSLYYVVNLKKNDTIYDQNTLLYAGKDHIVEQLGALKYQIGPKSFFQTNTFQAKTLYDKTMEFAELKGTEVVYDLYTGLGSIALYVANKCKTIVGIEEVKEAIDDAHKNLEFNNVSNAQFYAGDVKNVLNSEFEEKHGKPDLVITDPPRAGMHKQVIQTLLQLEAPRIVYVSCNPATQARDIELLSEKYSLIKVQPVDMFPYTHHVESIALLERH